MDLATYNQLMSYGKEKPNNLPWQTVVGSAIGLGTLAASFANLSNFPKYNSPLPQMEQVADSLNIDENTATNAYNTSVTNLGNKLNTDSQSGLAARGVNTPGTSAATKASVESSIGAARSSAVSALEAAKMNASNRMDALLGQYNINIANNQYVDVLNKYRAQQGLWGALGGIGGALANMPDTNIKTDNTITPNIGQTPYPNKTNNGYNVENNTGNLINSLLNTTDYNKNTGPVK
jgi:hypothetical protein